MIRPLENIKTLIFVLTVLLNSTLLGQNSVVINGGIIHLDGNASNVTYLVVDQDDTSGIVRINQGHIHSESQYGVVKWNSGNTNGSYIFPFGVGGNLTNYIPFTFNKTNGVGSIEVSTWGTNQQNSPKPNTSNVGAVTTMTNEADSVAHAIDRFWDIRASGLTADITFSYLGTENTVDNPLNSLRAMHWNGGGWDSQVGPGNPGVTSGVGFSGPFLGQSSFSPWILSSYCIAEIQPISPLCSYGSNVSLTAVESGGVWSGGGIIDSIGGLFSPAQAGGGLHEVIYTALCGESDTVNVDVLEVTVSVSGDTTISAGNYATLVANSNAQGFLWSPSDGLSCDNCPVTSAGPVETIEYIVRADSLGCYAYDTVRVEVNTELFIPTVFTPNNDGFNDLFVIENLVLYPDNEIYIFNRWGEVVYQAKPYMNDWGGINESNGIKLSGSTVSEDTYFYLLLLDEGQQPIKGSFELLID